MESPVDFDSCFTVRSKLFYKRSVLELRFAFPVRSILAQFLSAFLRALFTPLLPALPCKADLDGLQGLRLRTLVGVSQGEASGSLAGWRE